MKRGAMKQSVFPGFSFAPEGRAGAISSERGADPAQRPPSPPPPRFPCRLIELHSPDGRNTLILRCKDTATAHSWFMAIHTNIMALLPQVLAELNAMLAAGNSPGCSKEVKHIAWLAEQVSRAGGRGASIRCLSLNLASFLQEVSLCPRWRQASPTLTLATKRG